MEAIVRMSVFDEVESVAVRKFNSAALPRKKQLEMHVDAVKFLEIVDERNTAHDL